MGLNPHTSGTGNNKIDKIQATIHGAVSSLKLRYYLLQAISVLSILLIFWLLASTLEGYFYLSVPAKSVLWIVIILAAITIQQLVKRTFNYPDYRKVYRYLAHQYHFTQLSHLLDLADVDEKQQSGFHRLAIEQNLNSISLDDFNTAVSQYLKSHPLYRYFKYTGIGTTALLVLAVSLFAYNSNPFIRYAQAWNEFSPPNPYQFTVYPGSTTIEQGSSFQPRIQFSGAELPEEVIFVFKTDKEKNYRQQRMRTVTEDSLLVDELNISNDIDYYIKMDEHRSSSFNVDVQIKPRFANLETKVTPPEYTGIPTQTHTYPFSTIKVYPGSKIQLSGKSNKNLESLFLQRTSADTLKKEMPLSQPDSFSTAFTADMEHDTLQFTLVDSNGLTNDNPFRIRLAKQEDQGPVATIHNPESSLKLNEPRPVVIEYSTTDDFGLVKARLAYTLEQAYVQNPIKGSIPLDLAGNSENEIYEWPLDTLDLKPRDKLTYWIEVWDNDTYQGYKKGTSRKQTIAISSMSEYVDNLDEKESEVSSDLDDLSKSHEQMQKQYERFKKQLKRDPQADWEDSKSLKEVSEKRQDIQKKAEELNKKFKELTNELKNNNMLSKETLKAYQELQDLMDKIDDPELLKQLQKMQENLQNMSQDQLKKSMEDIEFDEELYKERLERTKELFQKLKLNSDLEKMARSLDRLGEEEKELSESADSASAEQQSKQQKNIKEDLQKVKEQLNETSSDSSGFSKQIRKNLESLNKETKSDFEETEKSLQENLEKLEELKKQQSKQQKSGGQGEQKKQGDNQKLREQIQQQQQQIQQQMQQMSSKMRQTKSQMNQQQSKINLAALMYIQQNLVMLSEDQEQLNRETQELSNRSAAFVSKARSQERINQEFQQLADSLFSVSSEMPSISSSFNRKRKEVARNLERSVEMLAERDKNQSTSIQRMALGGVNEMASQLTSIIDQLRDQMSRQPGGGGGMNAQQMMKKLQNMSGNQKKLNQQIQKMINDIQGQRLSHDQMERLKQMARQQNSIRKQLKQLQEEGSDAAGDKLMSEMERMAEQMEDTINDLRGGSTDAQLVKRQQNILSRMLNAEKAVQERGKSEKRKARRPEDYQQRDTPQMTMEELRQEIRSRLNDPDQTDFKEDYQKLIEYYFELLEDLNVEEQIN